MTGLLLKDLYTLRQHMKSLALILVLFAVISAKLDNPAAFFEGFIVLMSTTITLSSFSYDELAKWNYYVLSLPLTRKEIVGAKYLLSLTLCLTGAVLSFLLSSVVLSFHPVAGFGLREHLVTTMSIACAALFISSFLLPLIFRFGAEKSRLFMIAIFAMPAAAVAAFGKTGLPVPSESSFLFAAKLLPLLVIALYWISYRISVRIFSAKEF